MSSYDIGVWYSPANLSDAQAADYFDRLNSRMVVVEHHPEFDAFLREVVARFPDRPPDAAPLSPDEVSLALLETWDDLKAQKPRPPMTPAQIAKSLRDDAVFENSPWGASLSANGDTTELPFRWSRAEAAIPVVDAMALRHGLTVYDSQTGRVTNPARQPTQEAAEFLSVHLTLRLAGQPPAVDVTLVQDGQTVLHTTMLDRATAHAAARRAAIERHDRAYEVVDSRSLSQGMRVVPVGPGEGPPSPDLAKALHEKGVTIQMGTIQGPDDPVAPSVPAPGGSPLAPPR